MNSTLTSALKVPFFFLYLGLFLVQISAHAIERAPLFLKQGEQRLIRIPDLVRYSVSGKAIRYTRPSHESSLLIKGVAVGVSQLTYQTREIPEMITQLIRVESKIAQPYPTPLFQALNQLTLTETIDSGTQFILRGKVRQLKEAQAIASLKKQFSKWIVDETEIEPEWLQKNLIELSTLLKPYPLLKLQNTEGSLLIQGNVPNAFTLMALEKKIQSIQPLTQFDVQTASSFSPTLYFKVYLLEVLKKYSSRLGSELEQPIITSLTPPSTLFNTSLTSSVYALAEKGTVRILSAPELVVKSPGQAELFAGGEMPIRLINRREDKVVWKNVGLLLKLDVKEYNGERVRLSIETELNHLNEALSLNAIPGMQTNRLKTQVEGTMGKPLLLSGLLQEDTREKIKGLPGLSEIPILGKLFGSEDFQKDRSELVAVLVPYREPPKEPMQRISSDIPKGYLPLPRNYLSPEEVEKAQSSREYPWNVL